MQLEQDAFEPEDVAERLAVSVDTVYRLIRRGELRATRIGRRYSVPAQALVEFLERAEHEEAEQLFTRSLELGRLYVDKGIAEDLAPYLELAEAKLRRAAELRPTDPLPRYELVRALLLRGCEAEAERAFEELEAAQDRTRELRRRERRAARP